MHFTDSISHRRQVSKQRDFLTHFARSGNVLASAKQAGVSRALIYYWRENSPAFAEKLSAAAGEAFGETLAGSQQSGRKAARGGPGRKLERSKP
jgi:MOSC domain-containing protein YiiM